METLTLRKKVHEDIGRTKAAIKSLVAECYEAADDATKNGAASEGGHIVWADHLSAEGRVEFQGHVDNLGASMSALKALDMEDDKNRLEAEKVEFSRVPQVAEARIKANTQTMRLLRAIATGDRPDFAALKAVGFRRPADAGSSLQMPMPAIVPDSTGKAEVHAFPFIETETIAGEDATEEQRLEATYRNVEIMRAGKAGQYDPATGARLTADAPTTSFDTFDVPGSVPDLAVDLFRYLITMNEAAMYCRVYQTMGNNALHVTRRTGIPKAAKIGNRANQGQNMEIAEQISSFTDVEFGVIKYAHITPFSYESLMTTAVWSVTDQIAEDGAMGLANGFGEDVILGSASASGPIGIHSTVLGAANSSKHYAAGAADTAFAGSRDARTFNIDTFVNWIGSLPIPYFRSARHRILCNLGPFTRLLTVTDAEGNPIFIDGRGNAIPTGVMGVPALLDQNMPGSVVAGSTAVGTHGPFVLGDFQRAHGVRYAGGPRIDFSKEEYWGSDSLAFRFILCADSQELDINAKRVTIFT